VLRLGWSYTRNGTGSLSISQAQSRQLFAETAFAESQHRLRMQSNERGDIYALLEDEETMSIPALFWLS
jgi:hypothetical protein